jgi:hypothetical protein
MADYTEVKKGSGASPNNPIPTVQYSGAGANQPNPAHRNVTEQYPQGTSPTERERVIGRMKQTEDEKREKINKKEEKELIIERDRQNKAHEKREAAADKKYRRNAGVEIPKQGLHRFGHAGNALTSSKGIFGFSMSPDDAGYADSFSGGSANLFGSKGTKGAGNQMHVNFGRMTPGFGGLGNAMKKDGKAKGFGGYQDPFAGSSPIPKVGKITGGKKRKGKQSGSSIFNLRLF